MESPARGSCNQTQTSAAAETSVTQPCRGVQHPARKNATADSNDADVEPDQYSDVKALLTSDHRYLVRHQIFDVYDKADWCFDRRAILTTNIKHSQVTQTLSIVLTSIRTSKKTSTSALSVNLLTAQIYCLFFVVSVTIITHNLALTGNGDQYSDVFVDDGAAASDVTCSEQQQQQPTASMTSAEDDEERAAAAMWDANAEDLVTICGSSLDIDDDDDELNSANVDDHSSTNDVGRQALDDG